MEKETRASKSGRFVGRLLDHAMQSVLGGLSDIGRESYLSLFERELRNFSFEKVPVAQRGMRKDNELEDYVEPDMADPVLAARTVKEAWHLLYQTSTIYKDVRGFLSFFMGGEFRPTLDKMRHLPPLHKNWEDDDYSY